MIPSGGIGGTAVGIRGTIADGQRTAERSAAFRRGGSRTALPAVSGLRGILPPPQGRKPEPRFPGSVPTGSLPPSPAFLPYCFPVNPAPRHVRPIMAFRKTRAAASRGRPSSCRSGPEVHLSVRRTGFAAILYPILHPRDAGAAAISADTLELARASRSAEIPLGDIEGIDATGGRLRNRIRIFHAGGIATVSGLSRETSQRFADALEAARVRWWRERLAAGNGRLHAVHHHVSQLANPPRYLTGSTARRLEHEAGEVSGLFPSRWPDTLSEAPDIRRLHAVRDFLAAPDLHRRKANAAFAANELVRSRTFFDRIETRPLTDEQRNAIVADEDRTLVVAAAGSGKTSVIVAKAGWLLHRGYRQPSELLVLAFARDARKELEERLRKRLGGETADRISVRTFHALGLAIIGEAEGRRPTLARTAEDARALHGLLQRIVAGLLADGRFGDVMRRWFADHFAPYRSQHEFRSWGDYWNYIRQYEIRSLQGDRVRSFEECEIANFLYLNGIPYEYERPYEHDTATPDKTQYRPDFHLSEAGIYIEHFAITEEGNTPRSSIGTTTFRGWIGSVGAIGSTARFSSRRTATRGPPAASSGTSNGN